MKTKKFFTDVQNFCAPKISTKIFVDSKLLIIAIISLMLFAIILFNLNLLAGIDEATNSFSQKIQIDFLVQIAKAISWLLEPINMVIVSIIISVFLLKRSKKDALLFSITMLLAGLLIYILKNIIERIRPENALIAESNFSFPSGHALASLVFFGFLAYFLLKRTKSKTKKFVITISAIIVIILIGFSRLYLNIHWLSDVLAGFLLGLFLLFLALFTRKNIS